MVVLPDKRLLQYYLKEIFETEITFQCGYIFMPWIPAKLLLNMQWLSKGKSFPRLNLVAILIGSH